MAQLCSENGRLRMDWVDSVQALLADPRPLAQLEELAATWRGRGVRHILWSGMGGSGVTVGVLSELGLTDSGGSPSVHVLDSTDPAALDALVASLCEAKRLPTAKPAELCSLLCDIVLVAVSLGVTSEEPASHLSWFLRLLETAGLPAERHVLVLTVPGSRLEESAVSHGLEVRRVHLAERGGFPGRMSAPASSVFLLPVALGSPDASEGKLHRVLEAAWAAHDLAGAVEDSSGAPYVRFAEELAARTREHVCRLLLELPEPWEPMHVWIEQLLEQTLGKDGKGVVVFPRQRLNRAAGGYRKDDLVLVGPRADADLAAPLPGPSADMRAAVAQAMLGWQVTVALLGYQAGTNVVDEPAVEDYKARARALREEPDVLSLAVEEGALEWPACGPLEPVADTLVRSVAGGTLSYLDLTINGELDAATRHAAGRRLQRLGNDLLGVPVKLRRAPAAYHVSEQCQLDGPPGIVSLRVVAREAQPAGLGGYTPQFLHAQAVATWQAMRARGRDCTLVVLDELGGVVHLLSAVHDAVRARLEA